MSVITKKLNVEGMSCSHCEKAVKNALSEIKGVSDVAVDLEGKTVTVVYDTEQAEEDNLAEAIEDAGYDVVR